MELFQLYHQTLPGQYNCPPLFASKALFTNHQITHQPSFEQPQLVSKFEQKIYNFLNVFEECLVRVGELGDWDLKCYECWLLIIKVSNVEGRETEGLDDA